MTIYSSDKAAPYVYICTHKDTNQFYIGYRERNVKLNLPSHLDLPEYKTSSMKVRPDWPNYTWTIIAEFFDPSHAYTFEQQMIFDNWGNPLLLNRHCNIGKNQFRVSGVSPKKGILTGPNGKKGKPNGRLGIPTGPNKGRGKPHSDGWRGYTYSEESKQKMRKPKSEEHKQKLRKPRSEESKQKMRKPKSEEHKQNMRKPKGKQQNPAPKIECPHCGLVGGTSAMKHYHFDNCKKKPI